MDSYFNNGFKFKKSINIVFLCGSHFNKHEKDDKRLILKEKILLCEDDFYPVILEENFCLKKSTSKYLGYDDIFLNDLSDIEKIVSVFASKIIIIHDSFSTAAELGVFACNKMNRDKIAVLCPQFLSIDEDKIGYFSKISFFNHNSSYKSNLIYYSPDLEINKISKYKSDYYTYFHNNQIGENLWNCIDYFLRNKNAGMRFSAKKYIFSLGKTNINDSIEYHVNKFKEVYIKIKLEHLPTQICFLLSEHNIRQKLIKPHKISEIVGILEQFYYEIIFSTIRKLEYENLKFDKKRVNGNYENIKIRDAVALTIYLLQAAGFIDLISVDSDYAFRKVAIKEKLRSYCEDNKDFFCNNETSKFNGIKNE